MRGQSRVERLTMAARKKSKKTTKSKTKKTRPASSAKTASRRASKSPSSVRSRAAKSKPASSARAARKTIRAKMKNIVAKPLKRKRKNPGAGTVSRTRGAAKRLAKAASARKPASSRSPSKAVKSATVGKAAASAARARAKKAEAKLVLQSRGAPEARTTPDKTVKAVAGTKPSPAHSIHIPADSTVSDSTAKPAAPAIRVQKAGGSEEAVAKSVKTAGQRQGFKLNEFVVYPAHGVGQIVAIEEQEVAGFRLELFVISFSKDK